MLIFIDAGIPQEAKKLLSGEGRLVEIATKGITYESISGHPDIFLCRTNHEWVVAPNLPCEYIKTLESHQINFTLGTTPVGQEYPATASYNVVVTDKYLIHHRSYTDRKIQELSKDLEKIHVKQGYTRCNLLAFGQDRFITSDRGIFKALKNKHPDVFYLDPAEILLPWMKSGFIGGCGGVHDGKVYILGSLDFIKEGDDLRNYIMTAGYLPVELYPGPFFDGGGILFVEPEERIISPSSVPGTVCRE